jgi:hypothetical protein
MCSALVHNIKATIGSLCAQLEEQLKDLVSKAEQQMPSMAHEQRKD